MNFSLKKRELILIAILFTVIYAFVAYYFVYAPYKPKLEQDSADLTDLKDKKAKLDSDLANLSKTKLDIKSKTAANEKYEEYLMDNASTTDGVDLIEKIAALMGREIKDININKPEEKKFADSSAQAQASPNPNLSSYGNNNKNNNNTSTSATSSPAPTASSTGKGYYAFKIEFKSDLTFNEANEIVKFCEGGSRKMSVDKFELKPLQKAASSQAQKTPVVSQQGQEQKYEVHMTISFYSINLGNTNKLYEYSRNRFNQYKDDTGNNRPFVKPPEGAAGGTPDIASIEPATSSDDKKKILLV